MVLLLVAMRTESATMVDKCFVQLSHSPIGL